MAKWLNWLKRNGHNGRKASRQLATQSQPSRDVFILESLENRILLSATPMEAVVITDKADYSPGETAIITTSNEASTVEGATFADGEMVQFHVTRTDGVEEFPSGNLPWYVIDGGVDAYQTDVNSDGQLDWVRADNDGMVNGSISTTWFVEDQYANSSLLLTATGLTSGTVATHEFTDSVSTVTVTTTNPSLVIASGATVNVPYAFSYQTSGTGQGGNTSPTTQINYTVELINGSYSYTLASGTISGLSNGTHYVNATNTSSGGNLFASWTAPTNTGNNNETYTLKVTVTGSNGGGSLSNSDTEGSWITVQPAPTTTATTTTVVSSLNASTYGDSVTFTATVTATSGTTAPAGSVSFYAGTTLLGTDSVANSTGSGTSTWSVTTSTLNSGNHSITAVYAPATGFATSTSSALTQTVNKATATVTVTGYTGGTYDALAHTQTVTVTGVGGLSLFTDSLTGTNGGNYSKTWSYSDSNYNTVSGTLAFVIAKATATVTVVNYTGTYDGAAHTASVTITGVGGVVLASNSLTGTNVAESGTTTASIVGLQNYHDASGTATLTITKAASTTITNGAGPFTYDGTTHTGGSGTVTGAGGLSTSATSLTYSGDQVNAGTYYVTAHYAGDANHEASDGEAVAIVINQATATVTVVNYTGTYDGAAHTASVTITGVGGVVLASNSLTGTNVAESGTTTASIVGLQNYHDASGTATLTITKANVSINIGNATKVFGQTINLAAVLGTTVNSGVNGETFNISYSSAGVAPAALMGGYAITGALSNGTGSLSNYNVTLTNGTLTVATPSVITTVQDGANVLIVGTNGCDTIVVNASNPSAVTVNGTGSYTVGVGGHVIVYGMACDDNISLTGNVNLESHGGDGNDAISGGAGHDVLWGDQGNDNLTGAAGNDVLIGGDGSDRLVGSAGHDILVAGDLQGHNYDSLRTISANWAANWIADGDLGDNNNDDDVVDEDADQLTGSSGHDWFIIGSGDKITDINSATKDGDKITNI